MSFKELLQSSGYSLSIMKKNKKVVKGNVDERVLFNIRQAKPLALRLPVLQDLSGLPPGWSSFMTRLGIPELVTLRNSDNGLNCFYQSISDAFSGKISLQQVRTLLANFVTPEDVKAIGLDVLRHRVIVTYEAEADELSSEDIVKKIFDAVEVP